MIMCTKKLEIVPVAAHEYSDGRAWHPVPKRHLQPGRANEKAEQLCANNPGILERGTVQQAYDLTSRSNVPRGLKEEIKRG